MLHIALRNKIQHPELRLLYDSKMPLTHPSFSAELKSSIKKLRQKFNSHMSKDPLTTKLEMYDNDGGWYIAKVKEFVKSLYTGKNPPNEFLGQWRSVEFECVFKSKKDLEDFALLARQCGMGKFITIKTDGSLRVDRPDAGELPQEIVLSYRAGDEKVVHEFCRLLRGRAYVNKTCGTHVHFDFRHVGVEEANLYGKRLARCVPALRLLLPAARRTSEYCRENINNYAQAGSGNAHARYAFINMFSYAKYKSIEIRGHSGTINADKILNWIKLCEIIMATDLNFTGKPEHRNEVVKIDDLLTQYADKLDAKMIEYIKGRAQAFSQVNVDEAENTLLAQEVPPLPMFNPAKKKPVPKKVKKKKKDAGLEAALNAQIPPVVNIPAEVVA